MSFIRLGLIGAGNIGREHISNLALLKDVAELIVVADNFESSRREARQLLDRCGMERARIVENYEEVLEMPDVDAVIISTPNVHHIQVVRAAAKSGKALMIEKPLCTTLADCKEAVELAEASKALWWVGMEYRYIPSIDRLISEVTRGTVGNLRMLSIREHRFPFLTKVNNWNRFNKNSGGTLVEKCCHFFDLMLLIIGSAPVRVFGSGGQDVNHLQEEYDGERPDILDNAYVVVDFANGARACLDLCMFAEASRNQEEIIAVGDRGKMEAFAPSHGTVDDDLEKPNFVIGTRTTADTPHRDPPAPSKVEEFHVPIDPALMAAGHHCGATYFELAAFVEAVAAGKPPAVSTLDGLRAVALGIAAQTSIEEKRIVEMSELGLDAAFEELAARREPMSPKSLRGQLKSTSMPDILDTDGFRLKFYLNNGCKSMPSIQNADTELPAGYQAA